MKIKSTALLLFLLNVLCAQKEDPLRIPDTLSAKDRICFALYTVHENTLKLTAQFYPIQNYEPFEASLQIKVDGEWKEQIYLGTMKAGKREGGGIFEDKNGNRYEGQWKNDKRHGQGSFVWADGDRHEGDWKAGKRHGRGIYEWANGNSYDGEWKNDKQHGYGIITLSNSRKYDVEFIDG